MQMQMQMQTQMQTQMQMQMENQDYVFNLDFQKMVQDLLTEAK